MEKTMLFSLFAVDLAAISRAELLSSAILAAVVAAVTAVTFVVADAKSEI